MLHSHTAIAKAWNHLLLVPPPELVALLQGLVKGHFSVEVTEHDIRHFIQTKADPDASAITPRDSHKRLILHRHLEVDVNASGDMLGAKPRSFSIGGETRLVKSWKEMLVQLCEIVASQNENEFHLVINHICGKHRSYFSHRQNSLRDGRPVAGTDVFVEANLSANNIKSLCDAISRYFGYGPEVQVQFWNA